MTTFTKPTCGQLRYTLIVGQCALAKCFIVGTLPRRPWCLHHAFGARCSRCAAGKSAIRTDRDRRTAQAAVRAREPSNLERSIAPWHFRLPRIQCSSCDVGGPSRRFQACSGGPESIITGLHAVILRHAILSRSKRWSDGSNRLAQWLQQRQRRCFLQRRMALYPPGRVGLPLTPLATV